jgi:membrane protease YdiL (CAAX protease family)
MKTAALFNLRDFKGIFIQAFTAETDKPLIDSRGRPRGDLFPALAVLIIASGLWLLMNRSFQPRFLPVPYRPDRWLFVSLGANLVLGTALFLFPRTRPLALVPYFFTLFPAAFLTMTLLGEPVKALITGTGAANYLDWKFVYDCLFFGVEILLALLMLKLSRTGNPLGPPPQKTALPLVYFVRFWELLFIAAVAALLFLLLLRTGFPPGRFVKLLRYQIPFALLLGFKEELLFRWILLRLGERLLRHRFAAVCFAALLWSLYHGLYGEGVGSGFWSAFWVCVVSFWWSLVSYRYNSIRVALGGHFVIELYGFYLMYIPFLG